MILYIATFVAAVVTIIDLYYRLKDNNEKSTKSGIIRKVAFPIIIVFSIFYGGYEVFNSTLDIFKTQDEILSQEYILSSEKKLLNDRYEENVKNVKDRYDREIAKLDFKMRGLSYENDVLSKELEGKKKELEDSIKRIQLDERQISSSYRKESYNRNMRMIENDISSINKKVAVLSQKDTLITIDKVYDYHKDILIFMSDKEAKLNDLNSINIKDLKLLEFDGKERKKEIENIRMKYVINLFLAFILSLVFSIIGVRKIYTYIKTITKNRILKNQKA